jgi:hypothetical protein
MTCFSLSTRFCAPRGPPAPSRSGRPPPRRGWFLTTRDIAWPWPTQTDEVLSGVWILDRRFVQLTLYPHVRVYFDVQDYLYIVLSSFLSLFHFSFLVKAGNGQNVYTLEWCWSDDCCLLRKFCVDGYFTQKAWEMVCSIFLLDINAVWRTSMLFSLVELLSGPITK